MSLFDRMRTGKRAAAEPSGRTPATSGEEAQRQIDEGNALEDAGRVREALQCYDAAVRLAPQLARAHLNRGNALLATGEVDAAIGAYSTALVHDRGYAAAHYNLGNAYLRSSQGAAALAAYRQALAIKPDFADAEVALGALYEDLGQQDDAAASYRRALQIDPGYAAAHSNLGNVLQRAGQHAAAVECYRHALECDAQLVMAQYGLANALHALGRHGDAVASYRAVLESNPEFHMAHAYLGDALQAVGQDQEAVASYRHALSLSPREAAIHCNLGNALRNLGNIQESIASFRSAVNCAPDLAIAHYNLANALHDAEHDEEAISSYRRALHLDPNHAYAYCNLGNLLAEKGRLFDALACFRRMLEIEPRNVIGHDNIGNVFRDLGQIDDAIASYQSALEIEPNLVSANSNLLFLYNYMADRPAAALAKARQFGELAARGARPFTSWPNIPEPGRKLRVGLVSGEFRSHPVGYFIESVLAALNSDSPHRLELYAYSNNIYVDPVSARIKASCTRWLPVARLSDQELAQRIRDDGIDVLIDLAGHTSFNRLRMFAWKPAPVQVSWLGYFATTGVAAIDYFIADQWTLPQAEEVNFTEKIWRMPETRLCFTAPDPDVAVAPLAALANGYVTFGCFNYLTKMNDAVVAVWARVLIGVPNSRLFLKSKQFKEPSVLQRVLERFDVHGVSANRLILEADSPRADYLAAYGRVDIALDPFPFPGGTTTVEALWMGVPVLTLAGSRFLARQGVGLLMNAGLADWVAVDADDYVARAMALASDLPRLATLRAGLRQQVLASPIFDAPRFARHFEAALRGMWHIWCKAATGDRRL
jgi:protein O-GlcNAc transferase